MACSHSSYVRTAILSTVLVFVSTTAMLFGAGGRPTPAALANRSDSQIESDFRTRLARSKLAAEGIQIRVKGGVATLTGKTSVVQHKGSATRMAKSAGARSVANQIEISAA